eukprot:COSAG04_NODE_1822_length_5493_cov_33.626251_4_plen_119_part_00
MDGGEPGAPEQTATGAAAAGAEATAPTAEPTLAQEEAQPVPLVFDKEELEELWRAATKDCRRKTPHDVEQLSEQVFVKLLENVDKSEVFPRVLADAFPAGEVANERTLRPGSSTQSDK